MVLDVGYLVIVIVISSGADLTDRHHSRHSRKVFRVQRTSPPKQRRTHPRHHQDDGGQGSEIQGVSHLNSANDKIEIQQMMFVSGEVAEPLSETTGLVEDIVRAQVVEMVSSAVTRLILDRPSNSTSSQTLLQVNIR
jgi:hypothetical protein